MKEKIVTLLISFLLLGCGKFGEKCEGLECLNGGVCIDGRCDCPEDYSGENCDILIKPFDSPCAYEIEENKVKFENIELTVDSVSIEPWFEIYTFHCGDYNVTVEFEDALPRKSEIIDMSNPYSEDWIRIVKIGGETARRLDGEMYYYKNDKTITIEFCDLNFEWGFGGNIFKASGKLNGEFNIEI